MSPAATPTRAPVASTPERTAEGNSRSGVPPTVSLVAATILAGLIAVHASGFFGSATYTVIVAAGIICGTVGLSINKPRLRWPWITIAISGTMWFIATLGGGADDKLGDLTRDRPLTSDFIALPAYLLFGAALVGMLRERRRSNDLPLLLDGTVLAFGAALAVHHLLIEPTLSLENTWLPARLVVAAYPTASLMLVGIAAQLAFVRGRSVSNVLMLVGTAGLVVGDVVWAFAEIGRIGAPPALLDIPYLLVPVCIGLAALHPSVKDSRGSEPSPSDRLPIRRYVAVSAALVAPTALVVFPGSITPTSVGLAIGLCLTSASRIAYSMRAEDQSRATLLYQATHDDLTDLPSRSMLIDEIDRRVGDAERGPVALLFIDLDHFKNVNDLMGHQAGDELLMAAADRIVATVREDDVVARISGDEFVVLTEGLAVAGARRVADRIRSALTAPIDLGGSEVVVTASVGVSLAAVGTRPVASELLQQADTAMYESKLNRNQTTVFDVTMQQEATRRMEIERLLRHATHSPSLTTFFQPIVDSRRQRVVGFEALLRWEAMGEPISPKEFIPIAEDSGMIIPIGAFVLDEACRQAAWWRQHIPGGSDLYISVNLSPRQVISPDIVDVVAAVLARHQLPAEALWLEITETVMTEDSAVTAAAMTGLRSLGVRLALDDFGTGYSSLSGLQYLPVSRLKIDRRFISGLGTDSTNDKLVRCITAVADSFGLDVVAEGVETPQQLARLHEFGCDQIQGWLYAPAVEATDVPATFARLTATRQKRRHRPAHTG